MAKIYTNTLLCFLISIVAGIGIVVFWNRPEKTPSGGWLSELKLSAEQREKIKAIWSDAMKNAGPQALRKNCAEAHKEFMEKLKMLITAEQQPRYNDLEISYLGRLAEIEREAQITKNDAFERTKTLLSADQCAKYVELRQKHSERCGKEQPDAENAPADGAAAEKNGSAAEIRKTNTGETHPQE